HREPGRAGGSQGLEQRHPRPARGPPPLRRRPDRMGWGGVRRCRSVRAAVRARPRQDPGRGTRRGGQARRRRAHGGPRHRPRRLPRQPQGARRRLAHALRELLSGHGSARGERPGGPRRAGRDRGHGGDRRVERMIAPRSFRYALDAATGVATLMLDRPERLNSLTFEVYAELRDTFAALDTEPQVKAVVFTGSGRGFCSGGDAADTIGPLLERAADGLLEFTRMTCDVIGRMRACRRPIVAAVNGVAAGAGAVLAAACDFRIAAETAKIAFLFTRVGLSGADMGASWLLPRIVGLGRATELPITAAFITPPRALPTPPH